MVAFFGGGAIFGDRQNGQAFGISVDTGSGVFGVTQSFSSSTQCFAKFPTKCFSGERLLEQRDAGIENTVAIASSVYPEECRDHRMPGEGGFHCSISSAPGRDVFNRKQPPRVRSDSVESTHSPPGSSAVSCFSLLRGLEWTSLSGATS